MLNKNKLNLLFHCTQQYILLQYIVKFSYVKKLDYQERHFSSSEKYQYAIGIKIIKNN